MIKILKFIFKHSFFKFAFVGFLGTITNLSIFFIFVDIFNLWPNVFAVLAFLVAGTQNYILHHKWTFKKIMEEETLSLLSWLKFNLTTLIGLAINLLVLNLILYLFHPPYKVIAQGCGVIFGTVFNYLGSKHFVFRKKVAS
ncbi:MAG: GtrA family protein [candidate division WOR-3 bacterium]